MATREACWPAFGSRRTKMARVTQRLLRWCGVVVAASTGRRLSPPTPLELQVVYGSVKLGILKNELLNGMETKSLDKDLTAEKLQRATMILVPIVDSGHCFLVAVSTTMKKYILDSDPKRHHTVALASLINLQSHLSTKHNMDISAYDVETPHVQPQDNKIDQSRRSFCSARTMLPCSVCHLLQVSQKERLDKFHLTAADSVTSSCT